jgi:type II secretory ATPase GspE/PulE/Tfp pilus assembly ATPase PilB-like protein
MEQQFDDHKREKLGEILVRTGVLAEQTLNLALEIAAKSNKLIGQVLIEEKFITPRDLATALSIQQKVPLIDLRRHKVRQEALKLVPEHLARKHNTLPVDIIGDSLTVVMGDTTNVQAIDDIAAVAKKRIEPMLGIPEEIQKAIDRNYSVRGEILTATEDVPDVKATIAEKEREEEEIAEEEAAQIPAMRNLNLLLQQAMRSRASDIHIEPLDDKLQVRFRIDGVLQDAMTLPHKLHAALISRIKVVGGMNIAERRRPQDGRFSAKVDNQELDIRVATANTVHGEMAVLRILPKYGELLELSSLGLLPDSLEKVQKVLKLPWGMILLGGPTGSGKTTTLYASINQLNSAEMNIMTIEDPVEYYFEGINQFQVNIKAGVTFAEGLRAFMRLDPDVILVGEIRDTETAKIATQAALTGHVVLSSIHANDAIGVLFRLIDLGIEPFYLGTALVCCISQRIVRRICPHCKEPYEPNVEEKVIYEREIGELTEPLYRGKGCNLCGDTGYMGRIGLFEVLSITEEIKRLTINGASTNEIRRQAIKEGMVPLMRDGMLKVKEGLTTASEVLRNVFYADV